MLKKTLLLLLSIGALSTNIHALRFEDFSLPAGDRPSGEFFISFKEDVFGQEGDFTWTGGPGNIGQIFGVLTPSRALLIIPWKIGDGSFHTKFFEVTPQQVGKTAFTSQADAFASWRSYFSQFIDQPISAVPDKGSSLVLLAGGLAVLAGIRKAVRK